MRILAEIQKGRTQSQTLFWVDLQDFGTHTECVFVGNGVMAKEVNENIKFESTFESGNKSEVAH